MLGLNVTQMLGLAAVRVRGGGGGKGGRGVKWGGGGGGGGGGSKEGRMLSELGEEQEKGVHTYTLAYIHNPPTHTRIHTHTITPTHTHR